MEVKLMSAKQRDEWNTFVAREPSFALLQSWEWGEFKERLGWKAFRVAVRDQGQIVAGAQMLIKMLPLGFASVAYIPRGPLGNWVAEDIAPQLLSELHRVARYYRAIFLKIEPPLLNSPSSARILQQFDFQATKYTNQPRATIILNLNQDLDDILKQMRQKTRQYIRKATREEITVRIGGRDDLPAFNDLMRMTGRRERFRPRTHNYYEYEWQIFAERNQTVLLMAFYGSRLIAARAPYYFGKQAAEFHAGSLGNLSHLHPNYLLVWEAIKWAKKQECCTYDLWGIPDEMGQTASEIKDPLVSDRTDGLWGVFRFKSGFSNNIVSYIGAYDYIYSLPLYTLIANRFFGPRILDRVAAFIDSL
jgi:lipid II:glycine glycyltransferase (peptidoglycan interpeptide bridge formation enzyme)